MTQGALAPDAISQNRYAGISAFRLPTFTTDRDSSAPIALLLGARQKSPVRFRLAKAGEERFRSR